MNLKNIITYTILSIFAFAIYYLSWIYWVLEFVLYICFYTLIFYFFHFLWTKFRKKKIMNFNEFINYFLKRISVFLIIFTFLFWWGAYLLNEIFPAPMPEYTLTDWKKIVIFQAMSHIWTKEFYEEIVNNITNVKKDWGVYFFEWVRPWKKENIEKFNSVLWMEFDENLYKNFSKLYWVTHQDNSMFLWLVNELDFNVDIGIDEIITLYDEKIKSKPEWEKAIKNKIPLDANKIIIETLVWLNDRQLKLLVYINQAILNFIIWSENTQQFLTNNFTNKDLFDIILWKRNEVLTDEIINTEYNNIYITYWLLHFKWVFELLKENNSDWKIISTKNLYPIKKYK